MLPGEDVAYLEAKGLTFEVAQDGGFLCVVLCGYRLPPGYSLAVVDLLLKLPAGWPDAQPDMFWVDPPITFANGTQPPSVSSESALGRTWQRFSRHLPDGGWRPGDNLETWLTKVRDVLVREVPA